MDFSLFNLPSVSIQEHYHLGFMLLSYLIALFTAYVALDIAYNLKQATQAYAFKWWIVGGSFVLGIGIWSMHFIGMQAWALPFEIKYNLYLTFISLLIALVSAGFVFLLLLSPHPRFWQIALTGLIAGLGVACMHYIGMAAMNELDIHYSLSFFVTSLFIVVLVTQLILWALIKGSQMPAKFLLRLGIASLIACAMWSLHFGAMHGSHASLVIYPHSLTSPFINASALTLYLLFSGFFILGTWLAFNSYKILMYSIQLKNEQLIAAQQLLEIKGAQLEQVNHELIQAAHQVGIVQITSGILHNIGNVLNHVQTSAEMLKEHMTHTRLKGLRETANLLQEQAENKEQFFISDPRAQHFPLYFSLLADQWEHEKTFFDKEFNALLEQVLHIKNVIHTQQLMIQPGDFLEGIQWDSILDDALSLYTHTFKTHGIQVMRELHYSTSFLANKTKVLQIVVNLIQNAKDALLINPNIPFKKIIIRSCLRTNRLILEIEDSGIGIDPQIMNHIFDFGFTTKPQGHGLGLYVSLILAKEMGGQLTVSSRGISQGSTFKLELPYYPVNEINSVEDHLSVD
jgi:NO-binding membrane sensor protein with MHYT domain